MVVLYYRKTLLLSWAGRGAVSLNGEDGGDALEGGGDDGIMTGGHGAGDVIIGIENAEGSNYNDVLMGDDGPNRLDGGDTILLEGFNIANVDASDFIF